MNLLFEISTHTVSQCVWGRFFNITLSFLNFSYVDSVIIPPLKPRIYFKDSSPRNFNTHGFTLFFFCFFVFVHILWIYVLSESSLCNRVNEKSTKNTYCTIGHASEIDTLFVHSYRNFIRTRWVFTTCLYWTHTL